MLQNSPHFTLSQYLIAIVHYTQFDILEGCASGNPLQGRFIARSSWIRHTILLKALSLDSINQGQSVLWWEAHSQGSFRQPIDRLQGFWRYAIGDQDLIEAIHQVTRNGLGTTDNLLQA